MPAYKLTKKIDVYRRKFPVDDFESDAGEGEIVYSPWAQVRPVARAESSVDGQARAFAEYKILIRFEGVAVSPENWIVIDDQRFDIVSAQELDGAGQYIEIVAMTENMGVGERTMR